MQKTLVLVVLVVIGGCTCACGEERPSAPQDAEGPEAGAPLAPSPGGEPPARPGGSAEETIGEPRDEETGSSSEGSLPDDEAPPVIAPSASAPYAVGVRTVELTDPARARSFAVDVWYPVDPAHADEGDDNEYEIEMALVGSIASLETGARRDAPPSPAGPFPLVLFSHGYGGVRFQSFFLTEHLASRGFVVAAPDHPGNLLTNVGSLGDDEATAQSAVDRPLDVLFVLERLLADELVAGLAVDGERIGVTGHSFGAWTALEVARREPRVDVVFPMAPGFRGGSTADFVAEIGRPLLIFGGSVDDTTPFGDQQAAYDVAARPRHLVKVLGAGHLDFSNLCDVAIAQLFVDDGCDPEQIDPAEVHARVIAIATPFLHRYLEDHAGYEPYLAAESVIALGRLEYAREP